MHFPPVVRFVLPFGLISSLSRSLLSLLQVSWPCFLDHTLRQSASTVQFSTVYATAWTNSSFCNLSLAFSVQLRLPEQPEYNQTGVFNARTAQPPNDIVVHTSGTRTSCWTAAVSSVESSVASRGRSASV